MYEFLNKLSFNRGTNIAYAIFGILLAPYYFLYQFANDTFKNNNFPQVLLLSLAIGAPIILIYLVFSPNINSTIKDSEKIDSYLTIIGSSCILSGLSFYVPSIIKLLTEVKGQREAIIIVSTFQSFFIFGTFFLRLIATKYLKKRTK